MSFCENGTNAKRQSVKENDIKIGTMNAKGRKTTHYYHERNMFVSILSTNTIIISKQKTKFTAKRKIKTWRGVSVLRMTCRSCGGSVGGAGGLREVSLTGMSCE